MRKDTFLRTMPALAVVCALMMGMSARAEVVVSTSQKLNPSPYYNNYGGGVYNGTVYTPAYNGNNVIYSGPEGPGANAPNITVTADGTTYRNGQVIARGPGAGPGAGTTTTTTTTVTYNNAANPAYINPGITPAVNAATGWINQNGAWYYRYANGSYAQNTWDRVDDKWYFFDADGRMHKGWLYYNDKWYYCLPSGERATGWNNVNEKWYYLNESGIMQTGYIYLNGKTYYTDASGARVQSAYNPDGHQFDLNGVMIE